MATKLKEVDVVLVGMGWTGGILAKELSEAGLKVVGLERGAMRTTAEDFSVPRIRDDLRFASRNDLMQDPAKDTLTIRNNPKQDALPMRRLGSFLPGQGVGGAGSYSTSLGATCDTVGDGRVTAFHVNTPTKTSSVSMPASTPMSRPCNERKPV